MTEQEFILTDILNYDRVDLYTKGISLTESQALRLERILSLRRQGLPLQYILGWTEFMGLRFAVDSRVFIPRPETEILVEEAIKLVEGRRSEVEGGSILEIGTGSGCIAVSLAKNIENVNLTAVDISEAALELAFRNAQLNQVAEKIVFIRSDLFENIKGRKETVAKPLPRVIASEPLLSPGERSNLSERLLRPSLRSGLAMTARSQNRKFDVIISNPPYIPSCDIDSLQQEVRFEPKVALDGGRDGLDFYRRIIKEAKNFLKEQGLSPHLYRRERPKRCGGLLLMELGYNQRRNIEEMVRLQGEFEILDVVKDYSGVERVIILKAT